MWLYRLCDADIVHKLCEYNWYTNWRDHRVIAQIKLPPKDLIEQVNRGRISAMKLFLDQVFWDMTDEYFEELLIGLMNYGCDIRQRGLYKFIVQHGSISHEKFAILLKRGMRVNSGLALLSLKYDIQSTYVTLITHDNQELVEQVVKKCPGILLEILKRLNCLADEQSINLINILVKRYHVDPYFDNKETHIIHELVDKSYVSVLEHFLKTCPMVDIDKRVKMMDRNNRMTKPITALEHAIELRHYDMALCLLKNFASIKNLTIRNLQLESGFSKLFQNLIILKVPTKGCIVSFKASTEYLWFKKWHLDNNRMKTRSLTMLSALAVRRTYDRCHLLDFTNKIKSTNFYHYLNLDFGFEDFVEPPIIDSDSDMEVDSDDDIVA